MPKERKTSAPKLTRQQVKDGLDYIPIDTLLLGKVKGEQSLSHKQKEFARLVALGETKTGAYRKAYDSKGKPAVSGWGSSDSSSGSLVARISVIFSLPYGTRSSTECLDG